MLSRGAVHDKQTRSAFVQFCFRHGSGSGSGICATIGRPHKSATCAGSRKTLAALNIPTAKETSTFRRKAICSSLTHQTWRLVHRDRPPILLMLGLELFVQNYP